MTSARLNGRLLESVSRTFYLSVRLLPRRVRDSVGLAYLMARASDTIADTATASAHTRLRRLGEFEGLIAGHPGTQVIASIQRDIQPTHKGERALIAALPEVFEAFSALEMWDWKETSELLASIIRGQSKDIEVFNDPTRVVALPDADALEDYVYLVAGCVGEWWTRTCLHKLRDYSRITEDELTTLACGFGKALQLVNILRDLPADLAAGRCYLPADELAALNVDPSELQTTPSLAQPVFDTWMARARELIEQGRLYIAAIRTRRVRMACYIPWTLARQTLDLMVKTPPLSTARRVKVGRLAVYGALFRSFRVAFGNKLLFP